MKLKRKRRSTHRNGRIQPWRGYHIGWLPDGKRGLITDYGWLDTDGAFYSVKGGGIAKIQDIRQPEDDERVLYIYAPLEAVKEMGSIYISMR